MVDFLETAKFYAVLASISTFVSWLLVFRLSELNRIEHSDYMLACKIGGLWLLVMFGIIYWAETLVWEKDKGLVQIATVLAFVWIYIPYFVKRTAQRLIYLKKEKYLSLILVLPLYAAILLYTELFHSAL